MPEFLSSAFANGPTVAPGDVFIRLCAALVLGGVVAWIYCLTHRGTEIPASFPTTLVLLAVLIAMVTQVIGDNIARAFSLVGALSIVRFRTIVRDTQDTAYVIFSVVVGMAIGARNPWVAVLGLSVVAFAAFALMARKRTGPDQDSAFVLNLRVAIAQDVEKLAGNTLDAHLLEREVMSVGTAKQGSLMEVVYRTRFRPNGSAGDLVRALNRLEGVQSVQLERSGLNDG